MLPSREQLLALRRRCGLALFAVAMLALLSACGRDNPGPLRIATNNWPGYWPLFLAERQGRLDARLQELNSATEVLRAFRNRRVEAAALTLEEALQLLDEGTPLRIVLVLDYSNGADTVLAHPEIKDLADLRGRTIGAESTALGAFMVHVALARAGLREQDVRIVGYGVADHENAYVQQHVDALVTFEPVRSRLLARGAREIFSTREIPGQVVDVMIVQPDVLTTRADDLARVVAAWYQAVDAALADEAAIARELADLTHLDPSQYHRAVSDMHYVTREESQRLLKTGLADVANGLLAFMHDAALLSHPIDLAGVVQSDPIGANRRVD